MCLLITDMVMALLDNVFFYFARNIKLYAQYLPHSASIKIRCKILSLDMSAYIGITMTQGKDGKNIYPRLQKLNSTFAVLTSSSLKKYDVCHIEPLMYNEAGNLVFEMRKSQLFCM